MQHARARSDDTEAASTVNATYVQSSVADVLAPGLKLANLFELNTARPYFIQRLAPRTFFFGGGFYTTTFYVGDRGVLVFDPPQGQGANLASAIAEVTSLPVTAIVYSHNHADHMAGAEHLIGNSVAAGVTQVRLIASAKTAAKMQSLQCSMPPVNEVVAWPIGSFEFETTTVQLHGFEHAAHADDSSALLLVQEQVVHIPDLVNGDQPPFWRFAASENYLYYRANVNQVEKLDWIHHVGGHGNVGAHDDFEFVNVYLEDLEEAVRREMSSGKSDVSMPWRRQ